MKSNDILILIKSYLKEIDIVFGDKEDRIIYSMTNPNNNKFILKCLITADDNGFTCITGYKFDVNLDQRHQVAEYIIRINGILKIGSLKMDFDDGQVYYMNYHPVASDNTNNNVTLLNNPTIGRCIKASWFKLDKIFEDIQDIYNEKVKGEYAANKLIEELT